MKKIVLLLAVAYCSCTFANEPVSAFEMKKLSQAIYSISALYVDSVNNNKLIEDAILGALDKLDPHSTYIPAKEVARMNEPIDGSFDGIGITFQMFTDTLLVNQTISGCPAAKVGILPGDKFIKVDTTNIAGIKMNTSDIMKQLRGPKGSIVKVTVIRKGVSKPIEFEITRDKIPVYSIDAAYMIAPRVGYIKINSFSKTTYEEFLSALTSLNKSGMKSLIIDLQSNGGGLMNAAIELGDEFLSGSKTIVYTEDNAHNRSYARASKGGDFEQGKLVVLVDDYSASASEILAGALQDWDRAIIIGRRTFGKGLVQRPINLIDGSMIRLTVARYYTPSGRFIQKPYKDGIEKYHKDLEERFKHGELQHADSIIFPDSLKQYTLIDKRVVYGGGGIMPDIFVPLDTTRFTTYHRNLVARGILNKTTVEYIDANRKILEKEYSTFESFNKKFTVPTSLIDQLIANGEKAGINYDASQYNLSASQIQIQIKAILARDLFASADFFKVINTQDPIVQKGIEVITNYDTIWQELIETQQKK